MTTFCAKKNLNIYSAMVWIRFVPQRSSTRSLILKMTLLRDGEIFKRWGLTAPVKRLVLFSGEGDRYFKS
jgi:hypothetical protein